MKTISATALYSLMEENKVILIDAREPIEYKEEHIKGAILKPISNFEKEKGEIHKLYLTAKEQNKKLVIYCKGGTRGGKFCEKLTELSGEVYNLEGGINAFKQAGFAVFKGNKNIFPLERQMQITVGFLVLTFTLLGIFISSKFLILTCIMGAGLLFAGITGFCGLMKILAIMPWNKN